MKTGFSVTEEPCSKSCMRRACFSCQQHRLCLLLERHTIVWQVKCTRLAAGIEGEGLAFVCALDNRQDAHGFDDVCHLVILDQLARFVDSLVLTSEPLLAHEFERQNNVPLRIHTEH